jgi:hypothetical protein
MEGARTKSVLVPVEMVHMRGTKNLRGVGIGLGVRIAGIVMKFHLE